jgi:hypothetical protein
LAGARLVELSRPSTTFGSMSRPFIEILMAFVFAAVMPTCAWAGEEIKKDTVRPWDIEAAFKNDNFDHCAVSRSVDEVVVKFIRTNDGLSLVLQSPNWKLERGKRYQVHMKAGGLGWDAEVAAEPNSVSVPVSDTKFKNGIRVANLLLLREQGLRSEYLLIKVLMP